MKLSNSQTLSLKCDPNNELFTSPVWMMLDRLCRVNSELLVPGYTSLFSSHLHNVGQPVYVDEQTIGEILSKTVLNPQSPELLFCLSFARQTKSIANLDFECTEDTQIYFEGDINLIRDFLNKYKLLDNGKNEELKPNQKYKLYSSIGSTILAFSNEDSMSVYLEELNLKNSQNSQYNWKQFLDS